MERKYLEEYGVGNKYSEIRLTIPRKNVIDIEEYGKELPLHSYLFVVVEDESLLEKFLILVHGQEMKITEKYYYQPYISVYFSDRRRGILVIYIPGDEKNREKRLGKLDFIDTSKEA